MNIGELTATLGCDATGLQLASREMAAFEKRMQNQVTAINHQLKSAGDSMKKFGRSASTYITSSLALAGGASFKMYKDFDSNMSKITGLVGVARAQVNAWRDDVLAMAPAVGKSAGELSNALFFITSAGIKGSEAMEVLEMSAKAATAGLGDTTTVADLATSAMNAYGIANLSAEKAVDILVATVREGKAVPEELAQSMGQVLPIAAEMGVTFDQVGAMMAAMTRTGTNAATAATQLRAILASLIKPSKMAEDALKGMGTSSSELRKTIQERGLLTAMMDIKNLTSEYGEELVARVFPNIRALSGVLDVMGSNLEDNKKIFEALTNTTGTLNRAFEEATNTVEFKYNQAIIRAKTGLVSLGQTVSQSALPLLEKFGQIAEDLTKWFNNLSETNRKLIVTIGGVLATVGPLSLAMGFLVGNVLPMMITGVMGAVKAFHALKLAMLSNPFTAVAVAIAAVGAALYANMKYVQAASKTFDVWADMNNKAAQAVVNEKVELEKLIRIIKSEYSTRQQQEQALKKINQLSPEYLGNITEEAIKTGKAETAIRKYISALEQRARVQAAEEALVELEKERIKSLQDGANAQLSFWEKARKGGLMYASGMNLIYKKSSIAANEELWAKEKMQAAEERYQSLKRTYIGIIDTQIGKENELNKTLSNRTTPSGDGSGGGMVDEDILNMLKQLAIEEDTIRKMNEVLGSSFDDSKAKVDLYQSALQELIKGGLQPTDAAVMSLAGRLKEIQATEFNLAVYNASAEEAKNHTNQLIQEMDALIAKENSMKTADDIFLEMDVALASATVNAKRFGEAFDLTNAQIQIYTQALQALQSIDGPFTEEDQVMLDSIIAKLKDLGYEFEKTDKTMKSSVQGVYQLSSALSQAGSAIGGVAGNWTSWAASVIRDIPKIIAGITALSAATSAETAADSGAAVAKATKEGAKMPFPANLIAIATGVAAVLAALASIPKAKKAAKMEKGGTVPAGFPNDSYPAMLTSGETVVPPGDLPDLNNRDQLRALNQIVSLLKVINNRVGMLSQKTSGLNVEATSFGMMSVMQKIKIAKLAKGGTIPPGYPNDSYPALLSSGERVLPAPGKLNFERPKIVVNLHGEWRLTNRDIYFMVREEERIRQNSY